MLFDICGRSLIALRRLGIASRRPLAGSVDQARQLVTLSVLLLLGVVLVAGASSCGGSSGDHSATGVALHPPGARAKYAGTAVIPPRPSPPFVLKDSLGQTVDLKQYRGKAVLLTFIYTHCPDTCPLIVSHLKVAQSELGAAAKKLQIVAVSTDPRGDTPTAVTAFLRKHGMTGRMQYLIGSKKQLRPVWKAWYITAKRAPGPRDRVGHSAVVYGISASGKTTTMYPGNFVPSQIVHDVPLLASE
jgi:protein SCO1